MSYAFLLAEVAYPEFPTPIGVIRAVEAPCYEQVMKAQIEDAKAADQADIQALLDGPETWTVA